MGKIFSRHGLRGNWSGGVLTGQTVDYLPIIKVQVKSKIFRPLGDSYTLADCEITDLNANEKKIVLSGEHTTVSTNVHFNIPDNMVILLLQPNQARCDQLVLLHNNLLISGHRAKMNIINCGGETKLIASGQIVARAMAVRIEPISLTECIPQNNIRPLLYSLWVNVNKNDSISATTKLVHIIERLKSTAIKNDIRLSVPKLKRAGSAADDVINRASSSSSSNNTANNTTPNTIKHIYFLSLNGSAIAPTMLANDLGHDINVYSLFNPNTLTIKPKSSANINLGQYFFINPCSADGEKYFIQILTVEKLSAQGLIPTTAIMDLNSVCCTITIQNVSTTEQTILRGAALVRCAIRKQT